MPYFELQTHTEKTVLFSGEYRNFNECLEDAAHRNICLSSIDLRHRNLTNINLDGAYLIGAQFDGANLTGANMSEAQVSKSSFQNCALFNCCFAYSNMDHCDFRGAQFGATLIERSNISGCLFSTLSCFELEFMNTTNMSGCLFIMPDHAAHLMSRHPIVFKGLMSSPIVILDQVIKIGAKTFPKSLMPTVLHLLESCTTPRSSTPMPTAVTLIPPSESTA